MDKKIKVKQLTIDSMKRLGMTKALEKANSGSADGEFVEAAKRFYGNRVRKDAANFRGNVPKDSPAVIEDPAKKGPGPVVQARHDEAARKNTVSNKYIGNKKGMA